MPSSIFNFEHARLYRALPRREKWWHATLLATAVLVALGGCALLKRIYQLPPEVNFTSGAVEALSPRTQVLACGSSHFLAGMWPTRYSMPLMNLTTGGLNFVCIEALLNHHLPHLPGLKVVVIEVDDVPLITNTITARSGDLRDFLDLGLSPFEIPARSRKEKIGVLGSAYLSPIFNLPRVTPHDLAPMFAPDDALPSTSDDARWSQWLPGFCAIMKRMDAGYDPRPRMTEINNNLAFEGEQTVTTNTQALLRSIDGLRARRIKVVLLRLPKSSYYWKLRSKSLQISYDRLLAQLQQRYGGDSGVMRRDLTRDPEFSNRDFVDANHMNIYGAMKVAHRLDPQLRRLIQF